MSAFELGRLIGNFVGPVLLIGALVYVMRGGKVSFTEGVRHPLVLSLIVLTIAANAIPNPMIPMRVIICISTSLFEPVE